VLSVTAAAAAVLRIPFYAAAIAADGTITEARVCPQNYLCPGGIPESAFDPQQPAALSASEKTIKRCPNGLWTQDPGAYYVKQCRELTVRLAHVLYRGSVTPL
jgi:hypothetical protein